MQQNTTTTYTTNTQPTVVPMQTTTYVQRQEGVLEEPIRFLNNLNYGPTTSSVTNVQVVSTAFPPGWEMRYDQTGRAYYANHINKMTTYTDPRGTVPVQQTTIVQDNRSVFDPSYWLGGGTKTVTTTSIPVTPTPTPTPVINYTPVINNALPYGWEMRFDNQGRTYYADSNTKTTTYNDPRLNRK